MTLYVPTKLSQLAASVYVPKERLEGSFCHLEVRRAFAREKIYLQLGGILVSYIKYDWLIFIRQPVHTAVYRPDVLFCQLPNVLPQEAPDGPALP